ncbi:MAG: GNAT family N-acetyltransferase [Christensenella sp.]|nr:GNAT family N-acetyltransferase [Christensenella sp.]
MRIDAFSQPELSILQQVRALERVCQAHDLLKGSLFLDPSLNFSPEIASLLVCYEGDLLIGAMTLFAPTRDEVELVSLTHPDFRRRGVFRALLSAAAEQASAFAIPDLLLICEKQSRDGVSALAALGGGHPEYSEYALSYGADSCPDNLPVPEGLSLFPATEADLDDMARISAASFDEPASQARRFLEQALQSENRTQYIARFLGEPIGIGGIGYEEDAATIFGLAVHPDWQGRGIGRGMIALLLKEMLTRNKANILIEVNSANAAALHLYLSCGFVSTVTNGYYRFPVTKFSQK